MQFELPKDRSSIIKVIGVGGGGSNAVNHMYQQGIKGVDFIVCNTDAQALDISPVPTKIQLGLSLTEGLGAGSLPEVGKNSAIETIDEIRKILANNTKMVFITAGMGGGTGTGAAPIIASVAKEMGILTVGIVTLPFSHEGKRRRAQADEGIDQLKKNVDTLLVICNDKLREIYGNLKLTEAFVYADDVLTTAAKSIAEIITVTLHINVDFADIQTVMKDSGQAIMGSASASGENRAVRAVELALNSPLLNDNNITGARYILLNVVSGKEEITMDEYGEIMDYVQNAAGQTAEIIKGYGVDESLGEKVNVTIIATGFKTSVDIGVEQKKPERKILHLVEDIAPKAEVVVIPEMKQEILKSELEPTLKPKPEPVVEAKIELKPQPIAQLVTQPVIEFIAEPVAEIKSEPAAEVIAEPVAEIKAEPIAEIKTESVAEIKVEPIAEIKSEPVAEVVMEPVAEMQAEPIAEIKIEPVAEVKTEPIAEIKVEPIAEIKSESVSELIAEPVAEMKAEPIAEINIEPVAEITPEVTPVNTMVSESVIEKQEELVAQTVVSEVSEVNEFIAETNSEFALPVAETETKSEAKDKEITYELGRSEEAPVVEFEMPKNTPAAIPAPVMKAETPVPTPAPVAKTIHELKEPEKKTILVAESKPELSEQQKRSLERIRQLKALSQKLKSPSGLAEMEKEPAYKRREVKLENPVHSSESEISRFTLTDEDGAKASIKPNNSFLHDNVD